MFRQLAVLVPALLLLAAPLVADSIYLKTGTCLRGEIIAEHPDRIQIRLREGEVRSIPRSEIALIEKGKTRLDEFRDRLAAVGPKDLAGLHRLIGWCERQKMSRQRTQVLRKILGVEPNCPVARRALRQKWSGKSWMKDKKKGAVEAPLIGVHVTCEKLRLKVGVGTGWTVLERRPDRLRMSGPDRYRRPVKLDVFPISGTVADRFRKVEGEWTTPRPVTLGTTRGLAAERTIGEGCQKVRERETALSNGPHRFVVRLSSLAVEFEDWRPHLALILQRLELLAPRPDFVDEKLGVAFSYPKDDGWTVATAALEAGQGMVCLAFEGHDEASMAMVAYFQVDRKKLEGAAGAGALPEGLPQLPPGMEKAGGINFLSSRLGKLPARILEVSRTVDGVPRKGLMLVAVDGDRLHMLNLDAPARSFNELRKCFEMVRTTFTTDLK